MIFRRAPQHRGAADVDFLDGFFEGDIRLGDRFLEGIKVHDHEVDGWDVVRFGLGDVFGVVPALEQAAVDFRVERLEPTVKKLGRTGELRDVDHGQASLAQYGGSAAGREQLHAHVVEFFGKFSEASFIGNREKGAGNGHKMSRSR